MNVQQPVFAERPEPGLPPTPFWPTSMCQQSTGSTTGEIEVIANGLPLHQGAQLAVDTTLVSPLTSAGQPRQRRGAYTGAALGDADPQRAKERIYPELQRGGRCNLVVVALEVGGRWSEEAAEFVRLLAKCRSRAAPVQATAQAFIARWSALLTHAAQTAFAQSLLFQDAGPRAALDGDSPPPQRRPGFDVNNSGSFSAPSVDPGFGTNTEELLT